nr:HdeD family acid-resistance protein [Bdellovibrio sp. HAGR004]
MNPSNRMIFLGTVMLLLGIAAVIFASVSTLASVVFLGAVLGVAGVFEITYGVQGRKDGELWPHLGLGILSLACSFLIVRNPIENTLGLTLLVSFLLLASGLTKLIGSLSERTPGWGWMAISGATSFLLGSIVLLTFPASAFWTIGTFVGVDLILVGLSFIGMGVSVKKIKQEIRSAGQSWRKSTYRAPHERDRDQDSELHP